MGQVSCIQAAPIIVLNTPNWKPRNNHLQMMMTQNELKQAYSRPLEAKTVV